jgi:hypothetical protein
MLKNHSPVQPQKTSCGEQNLGEDDYEQLMVAMHATLVIFYPGNICLLFTATMNFGLTTRSEVWHLDDTEQKVVTFCCAQMCKAQLDLQIRKGSKYV